MSTKVNNNTSEIASTQVSNTEQKRGMAVEEESLDIENTIPDIPDEPDYFTRLAAYHRYKTRNALNNADFYYIHLHDNDPYYNQFEVATEVVPGAGERRQDRKAVSLLDFSDEESLNELRAQNIGAGLTIVRGLASSLVNAAATAIEPVTWAAGALFEGGKQLFTDYTGATDEFGTDYNTAYDIFFNPTISKFNAAQNTALERLNIERTRDEQDRTWLGNVFSHPLNFIFGDLLPGAGFTIGAAVGGKGIGGVSSRVINKLNSGKRAIQRAVKAGEILENASGLERSALLKALSETSSKGSRDLLKILENKTIQNNRAISLIGAGVAAATEGNIEGFNARKDFLDEAVNNLYEKFFNDQAFNQRLLEMYKSEPEFQAQYETFEDFKKAKFVETGQQITKTGNSIGLGVLAANAAFLTLHNELFWDSFFNPQYRIGSRFKGMTNASKFLNVSRNSAGEVVDVSAKELSKARKAWLRVKNPLGEAYEEMQQMQFSRAATAFHQGKLNRDFFNSYGETLNQDNYTRTYSVWQAAIDGFKESFGNPQKWNEGFIGFLIGGIGLPSGTRTTTDENGKKHFGLNWETGFSLKNNPTMQSLERAREIANRFMSNEKDEREVEKTIKDYLNQTGNDALNQFGILKSGPAELLKATALINSLKRVNNSPAATETLDSYENKLLDALSYVYNHYLEIGAEDIIDNNLEKLIKAGQYDNMSQEDKEFFDKLLSSKVFSGITDASGKPIASPLTKSQKQQVINDIAENAEHLKNFLETYSEIRSDTYKAYFSQFADDPEAMTKLDMLARAFAKLQWKENMLFSSPNSIFKTVDEINALKSFANFMTRAIQTRKDEYSEAFVYAYEDLSNEIIEVLSQRGFTEKQIKELFPSAMAQVTDYINVLAQRSYVNELTQKGKFDNELKKAQERFEKEAMDALQQTTKENIVKLLDNPASYENDNELIKAILGLGGTEDSYDRQVVMNLGDNSEKNLDYVRKAFGIKDSNDNKAVRLQKLIKTARRYVALVNTLDNLDKSKFNSDISKNKQEAYSHIVELLGKDGWFNNVIEKLNSLANEQFALERLAEFSDKFSGMQLGLLDIYKHTTLFRELSDIYNKFAKEYSSKKEEFKNDALQSGNVRQFFASHDPKKYKEAPTQPTTTQASPAPGTPQATQGATPQASSTYKPTGKLVSIQNKEVFNAIKGVLKAWSTFLDSKDLHTESFSKPSFEDDSKGNPSIKFTISEFDDETFSISNFEIAIHFIQEETGKILAAIERVDKKANKTELFYIPYDDLSFINTLDKISVSLASENNNGKSIIHPVVAAIFPSTLKSQNYAIQYSVKTQGGPVNSKAEIFNDNKTASDIVQLLNKIEFYNKTIAKPQPQSQQLQKQQGGTPQGDNEAQPAQSQLLKHKVSEHVYLSKEGQDLLDELNSSEGSNVGNAGIFEKILGVFGFSAKDVQEARGVLLPLGFVKEEHNGKTEYRFEMPTELDIVTFRKISRFLYFENDATLRIKIDNKWFSMRVTATDSGKILNMKSQDVVEQNGHLYIAELSNGEFKTKKVENAINGRERQAGYDSFPMSEHDYEDEQKSPTHIISDKVSDGSIKGKDPVFQMIKRILKHNGAYAYMTKMQGLEYAFTKNSDIYLDYLDDSELIGFTEADKDSLANGLQKKYAGRGFLSGQNKLIGIFANSKVVGARQLIGIVDPNNSDLLDNIASFNSLDDVSVKINKIKSGSANVLYLANGQKQTLQKLDPNNECMYVISDGVTLYSNVSSRDDKSITQEELEDLLGTSNITINTGRIYIFSPSVPREGHPKQRFVKSNTSIEAGGIEESEFNDSNLDVNENFMPKIIEEPFNSLQKIVDDVQGDIGALENDVNFGEAKHAALDQFKSTTHDFKIGIGDGVNEAGEEIGKVLKLFITNRSTGEETVMFLDSKNIADSVWNALKLFNISLSFVPDELFANNNARFNALKPILFTTKAMTYEHNIYFSWDILKDDFKAPQEEDKKAHLEESPRDIEVTEQDLTPKIFNQNLKDALVDYGLPENLADEIAESNIIPEQAKKALVQIGVDIDEVEQIIKENSESKLSDDCINPLNK